MQKSTSPNNSFDEGPSAVPTGAEIAGDADAVQKTTWVVGKGTDDRADHATGEASGGKTDQRSDDLPARGTAGAS